ncbi:MAG: alpha/beta hydrolase [Bacteroidales bacterium]|nr:alpha/beta hydrolase [Bacteroidales bacterium]
MKAKTGKALVISLVSAVVLVTAILIGGGAYMVRYALLLELNYDQEEEIERVGRKYELLKPWIEDLTAAGIMKDTVILTPSGEHHRAFYAAADSTSGRTAVIVHGYTSNALDMMMIGRMFRDSLGWNVLLPDLHAHGASEGRGIQMGWKDRLDVERWIGVAHDIFPCDTMLVHGISMGGATTMMLSGDELPEYVRAFIDDCGYSSVWDQFKKELKEDFGLPSFPLLNCASLICRIRFGWDFKTASAVNQLAKCTKPVLFIHGDIDDYVLTENVYKVYEAKTNGYKDMWIVPDTDHANAYRNHPAEYTQKVREFLKEAL